MAMLADNTKPTTLDEVRKAYERLSDEDKKSFSQSIADRVDESVGEQEAEKETADSQTALDRTDEAEGEEKEIKKEEEIKEDENAVENKNAQAPQEQESAEQEAHEQASGEDTEASGTVSDAETNQETKEEVADYAQIIKDILRNLSDAEYDEIFGSHQRRHLDSYVSEHKNSRPMPPSVQPGGASGNRPKVTLL